MVDPSAVTRRSFLGRALGTSVLVAASSISGNAEAQPGSTLKREGASFIELLRVPDRATAFAGLEHPTELARVKRTWQAKGIEIAFEPGAKQMPIRMEAPGMAATHLHLRWEADVAQQLHCLGDHWERSYGDLAWRAVTPERVMPWYFSTFDGAACHCYGVKTGAGALCFWQLDGEGLSLWLNVQNGGEGVELGSRQLEVATVVARRGEAGEGPFQSIRSFCGQMCDVPRLPSGPVYGSNDWYYAYGKNSAKDTLRDVDLMAELAAGNTVRPFTVIDDGWRGSAAFPDMGALAAEMRNRKVRPGIWIRPLIAPSSAERGLLMADARFGPHRERAQELAYDPTVPEALDLIVAKVTQVAQWGFELVKHDYSTYDLLGKWGSEMGAEPSFSGWSLHDRSRTNAEVILNLYRAIRKAAGEETLVLGCNTVGHQGAGLFELQRTGDDTSGERWERTRRMGVNTLAFRLPQHGTFFALDADCVGITKAVPWEMNRQWLDMVARSGTALFVSPSPDATGSEQRKALVEAFAIAAAGGTHATPKDWLGATTPEVWDDKSAPEGVRRYRWCSPAGASPFAL